MTETPRWVFVVRRDQLRLYEHLRRAFEGVELVEVILDRRQATGREGALAVGAERRQPLAKAEQDLWDGAGLRLVYKGEDWKIYKPSAAGEANAS
jgi:hypothetical protein